MPTTLVTGANKGLGREVARRLVEEGHEVWIGARNPELGRAAAQDLNARFVELDVTSDETVAAAAAEVSAAGGLDVLVNNAGIIGPRKAPRDTSAEDLRLVFETNVFGIVRVTGAFLAVLGRSRCPVIVNVSSGMGSQAMTTDPSRLESRVAGLAYSASKAALNMLTTQYAKALPKMRVNAADPGHTATDLNDHRGAKTVEQGAEIIVRMANVGAAGPTGTFVDEYGPLPW